MLLTTKQLAELLKKHPVTIYTWVKGGIIPCKRPGGQPGTHMLFDYDEVNAALSKKKEDGFTAALKRAAAHHAKPKARRNPSPSPGDPMRR